MGGTDARVFELVGEDVHSLMVVTWGKGCDLGKRLRLGEKVVTWGKGCDLE